jgi:hypothetical protein
MTHNDPWTAGVAVFLKVNFLNAPDPRIKPYRLPNGEQIYVSATDGERLRLIESLVDRVRAEHPGKAILLVRYWCGLGFFRYFAPDPGLRNPLFGRGSLRPYDLRELRDKFDTIAALIVYLEDIFPDPLGQCLSDDLLRELRQHFEPREYDVGADHPMLVLERIDRDGTATSAPRP